MEKVIVANPFVGICHMLVCAENSATDDEILAVCNRENSSGTTNGWSFVVRDGEGTPVVCDTYPDRLHILVGC